MMADSGGAYGRLGCRYWSRFTFSLSIFSEYIGLVLYDGKKLGLKVNDRQGVRSYAEPSLLPRNVYQPPRFGSDVLAE